MDRIRVCLGGAGGVWGAILALALLGLSPRSGAGETGAGSPAAPAEDGFSPQFSLHGFSDVTLRMERRAFSTARESSSVGFAVGQFDLYMVSRLANRMSFLAETVFEIGPDGETVVDVERASVKYAWSDLLRLSAGRSHTALGYWNEAFHHGALLQPGVDRPEALRFEDDGGILPVHSVGVEFGGSIARGAWSMEYLGNVANGRGRRREDVQMGSDLNRDKAVGLKLTLVRSGSGSLAFGPMIYRDLIPPDSSVAGREGSIAQRITGFHARYVTSGFEAFGEYYRLRNDDRATGIAYPHDAWYVIALVGPRGWRPYAGVDRLDVAEADPYFGQGTTDLTRGLAGIRVDVGSFSVVKLEYRHDQRARYRVDEFAVQSAFTF